MQKTIGINFNIQEKDYIQLFSNMPSLKFKKYKSVFTLIIIDAILCLFTMLYVKSLNFTSEEYNIRILFVIVVFVILTIIFLIKFSKKYKKMVREIAKEKYKELSGVNVTFILDKELNIIKINKRNIPFINEDIVIISTLENYLIYFGKKINSDKILIPKNGDDNYKNNLYEIINYLSKLKNTKITEENN